MTGDPGEQGVELCTLGGVERGADVVFVRCADLAELGHEAGAVVGEVEGVVAAVAGVAAALGEAAFLELVEEEHQPTGRRAELAGEGLLAPSGLPGDQAQQACLSWGEVQRGDAPGPARCGFSAELGEQERVPAAPSFSWAAGRRFVLSRTRTPQPTESRSGNWARYWWTERMADEPSPTAAATRFIEPTRMSPAANTPSIAVS
jgi:hypothetical protein